MEQEYRLEPLKLGASELERVSELLRLVFPKARHLSARYLAWQYAQNPDGEAVGGNAYAGDALVGHLTGLPLTARIEGEVRRGLLFLNSAVHPLHRRRRLQSLLSEEIFARGARLGYSFCISTGNRYSTKPLLTRFKMVGRLEARLGLGRPKRRGDIARPSFERIWSDEALRWRLANPEAGYAVEEWNGRLAVTGSTGVPGIGAILYEGPGEALAPSPATAPGPLRLWLGLDPRIAWRRSAFLPIPGRLRPSPLNLLFRDMTGAGFVPDPDRLIFQTLDFDAY